MHRLIPLVAASLISCKPTAEVDPVDTSPPEFEFSFVVLADPHIAGPLEHEERLAAAVEWINANASERSIELVFIVGDIGWGDGLATANALLSDLDVPWVPIIGDNEIHFGDEQNWDTVFAPQFEALAATMDFERGQVEVEEDGETLYLQNNVLTYRGLRWVGLDWCSRSESDLLSEFAELHDTPGGSLPFLSGLLADMEASIQEDVLLFSHHPMHLGMFDTDEMAALTALTGPLEGRVAGAYAGHVHLNAEVAVEDGGYTVWATDATWDDENTVRIVDVSANASTHVYAQELVILD
ncbi:MAG: metallophosphoesterase [Proteobacteria bacterium]|nr:metallophosphoesterase [Pseudomonadota bacterium]